MKATVVGTGVAAAMVVLAGCGGSGGSAAESSAPAIRGDVASSDASDPEYSGVTSPFDPEVIDRILNVFARSVDRIVESDPGITFVAEGPVYVIVRDEKSFKTVVKSPADASVVILE